LDFTFSFCEIRGIFKAGWFENTLDGSPHIVSWTGWFSCFPVFHGIRDLWGQPIIVNLSPLTCHSSAYAGAGSCVSRKQKSIESEGHSCETCPFEKREQESIFIRFPLSWE